MEKKEFKIGLIGVEFEENLSLRYLAGSLISNGFTSVTIYPYNSIVDAEELVQTIVAENYALIGVSMAFQVRAIEDMTLINLLRSKNYTNHITAGGQFATLHYPEIFNDCAGLNSIIRFEAETAVVELADALLNHTDLGDVPALVWQNNAHKIQLNNATSIPDNINQLALPLRKNDRPKYLGFKTTYMVGSRGCHATCKYCCVAALATERKKASRDSGGLTALAGTRRRCPASVADEIATLYFKHAVRIFEFQDDNWIHPKTTEAVSYFQELKALLDEKGVGQIGLTLKTRADSVQPEIIAALKEIGLIRVFVGIESGTQNLLSQLGRKSRDNVSLQALTTLREFKIPAYFNALLFGPDILYKDIEPELDFLEMCTDFPFEIVEVVIYGKTGLYEGLKKEQRLHGNYLDYEYDYLEEKTQTIHHIISQLNTRHFGVYSPIKMAADLGFNLGILHVFYPGIFSDSMDTLVEDICRRINADQINTIKRAAALVNVGIDRQAIIDKLTVETVATDLGFYTEIIALQHKMEMYVADLTNNAAVKSYYRAGALVQSGLVASIFFLCLTTAYAQNSVTYNQTIQNELTELLVDFNSKDWREVKTKLEESKSPISNYNNSIRASKDSISKTESVDNELLNQNYKHLISKTNAISEKRIKQDYKRLKEILVSHQPKIKIASQLDFYLDADGYVQDVRVLNWKSGSTALTAELKAIIIELLKDKQFYAYEAKHELMAPKNTPRNQHQLRRKRMRIGPLD